MDHSFELIAENIEIVAGQRRLLSNLSFKVQSGQALIIRGPNGVGKTSLLSVLSGLAQPESGQVQLVQKDTSDRYDLLSNIHYLGHKNGLKLSETVQHNLDFFARFFGGSDEQIESVSEQLKIVSLQSLRVKSLSAGQKRRLAFSRLLLSSRPLWLLDEPTAALDTEISDLIEQICTDYLRSGGMIIATSHLPFLEGKADVLNLSDWVPEQKWVDLSE